MCSSLRNREFSKFLTLAKRYRVRLVALAAKDREPWRHQAPLRRVLLSKDRENGWDLWEVRD
jgi:hypothetical protein